MAQGVHEALVQHHGWAHVASQKNYELADGSVVICACDQPLRVSSFFSGIGMADWGCRYVESASRSIGRPLRPALSFRLQVSANCKCGCMVSCTVPFPIVGTSSGLGVWPGRGPAYEGRRGKAGAESGGPAASGPSLATSLVRMPVCGALLAASPLRCFGES